MVLINHVKAGCFLKPKIIKISDGINLNIIPEDRFKTCYLSVNILFPTSRETAAKNALLARVLKCGTKSYPNIQSINETLDMLYGSSISAGTSRIGDIQVMSFSSFPLESSYADGFDVLKGVIGVLREMLFDPYTENGLLSKKYVEAEKKILIDRIRAQKNNKDAYAIQRCLEEMCKGDVYAIPPTGFEEQVKEITPKSLTEYYKTAFCDKQIEIYYIGNDDQDSVTEKIRELFFGIERKKVNVPKTVPLTAPKSEVRRITEPLPVNQGKLCIGFYTGQTLNSPDYLKFALFCELFGGSPLSKLFMNVRERLGLCYYCRALPDSQKGLMAVSCAISNENKELAEKEILLQLQKCKDGDITETELDAAKKSLINAFAELSDSPDGIKAWYFGRSLSKRDESPEEAAEYVYRLTADDVKTAAKSVTIDTVYFLYGSGEGDEAENDESENKEGEI